MDTKGRSGMSKPILVNLYGGPGAGKTTTALQLTGELKALGLEAEYVPEYARDLALEGRLIGAFQFDILMEQAKRLFRSIGTGIEFVVTDSPILLQSLYARNEADKERAVVLHTALASVFDMRNFIIMNDRATHSMVGRVTDKETAKVLDSQCERALAGINAEFLRVPKHWACADILDSLLIDDA